LNSPLVKEKLAVVLVDPRYPGNVGSVARAMANMGFSDLRLVRPCETDHPEARAMAVGARYILTSARRFSTLEEALDGIRFAAATTCRGGREREETDDPRSAARGLIDTLINNRAALVFGPEDRGLTTEELHICQSVVNIPSNPEFSSLNLSQAVRLLLWELASAADGPPPATPSPRLADISRTEEMYHHMERVLLEIGYLDPVNPKRMIRSLRRILNRADLEDRDVRAIRGIFSRFDWYMKKGLTKK
jgi:tRNA/rRNA methyltransferase